MKITTSILAAVLFLSMPTARAQVQRISLIEEFTGENCGPCAAANPALTSLVLANHSPLKTILLRYQVPIPSAPGPGSLYQDNPLEAKARMTYYSIQSAPSAKVDGIAVKNGHPGYLDQTVIDSKYQVNAPVSVTAAHSINKTLDSITVNIKVTAAQGFTPNGALKLHCALIEEEINFSKPTGSNGEKDFEFVMRKMLPNADGTVMTAGAWTQGQSQSFTFKAKIPAYIKSKTEMGVIAFVQTDGNKNVLNTAYSQPVALPGTDLSLYSAGSSEYTCSESVAPVIRIKNTGTTTITSALVTYNIDNGPNQTYNYSGNLASLNVATVTLPVQKLSTPGTHTINASITLPNGMVDVNVGKDTKAGTFFNFDKPAAVPVVEAFSSSTFPPSGRWLATDPQKNEGWCSSTLPQLSPSGSASGGNTAMYLLNYQNPGDVDELYLPAADFSGTDPSFSFYVAAAPTVAGANDKLEVMVSDDCGKNWNTVYTKSGSSLYTGAPEDTKWFEPKLSSDWRKETVSLSAVKNKPNVLIKFRVSNSGSGNALFIDDIHISGVTGITALAAVRPTTAILVPNPAKDRVVLQSMLRSDEPVMVNIVNMLGQVVYTDKFTGVRGNNQLEINTSVLGAGVYSVLMTVQGETTSLKLIIDK